MRFKSFLPALLVAGLGFGLGLRSLDAGQPAGTESEYNPQVVGVGETMILVVGAVADTEADARRFAEETKFGDMQGFYVDESDNYQLQHVYEQRGPSFTAAACPPGVMREGGCRMLVDSPGGCPDRC